MPIIPSKNISQTPDMEVEYGEIKVGQTFSQPIDEQDRLNRAPFATVLYIDKEIVFFNNEEECCYTDMPIDAFRETYPIRILVVEGWLRVRKGTFS